MICRLKPAPAPAAFAVAGGNTATEYANPCILSNIITNTETWAWRAQNGQSRLRLLLQDCNSLDALLQIHAHMIVSAVLSIQNTALAARVVDKYGYFGRMDYAYLLFERTPHKTVFLWNSIIRGYSRNGPSEESLELYYRMRRSGFEPDKFTFPLVLRACAELGALDKGRKIHRDAAEIGVHLDLFVGNALISMYAKCASVDVAWQIFESMPVKDSVSWNALIDGLCQGGHCQKALQMFEKMQSQGLQLTEVAVMAALQATANLGDLQYGRRIHQLICDRPAILSVSVRNSLLAMYARCGDLDAATTLFDEMPKNNIVSWNAMIAGYAQNGYAVEALEMFHDMQAAAASSARLLSPSMVTMASLLQACAQLSALHHGKCIHAFILRKGFEFDVVLMTAIVDLYGKCGNTRFAGQVFRNMLRKNVVSWNAMITGHVRNGEFAQAMMIFKQMQIQGQDSRVIRPNYVTLINVLPACANSGALHDGMSTHGYALKKGLHCHVSVATALIDMYAKCKILDMAYQVFYNMSDRNLISWNAMIAGYAQNGNVSEAIQLINLMQQVGISPDLVTVLSVAAGCADLAALQQGRVIHAYIIKSGYEADLLVGNSIVDMYTKCGNISDSRKTFDNIPDRDLISWNTMMAGYGMHGDGQSVLCLFSEMQQSRRLKPDSVTFASLLRACSHCGLVKQGWDYFNGMIHQYGVEPTCQHYSCMVDLLGRAGCLDEACEFINKMPCQPTSTVWGSLLGSCAIHHNIKIAEYVAHRLFQVEPANAGYYVLLANIYAAAQRWDDVARVWTMMKQRGVRKNPAFSRIEVDGNFHYFTVADKSHPQSMQIYVALEKLVKQIEEAGYVPDTSCVLHDVDEQVKKRMLYSHSEKLAIAFGLLKTSQGSPLIITKNLRVCRDCHNATKFISKITGREIIMGDANRFHCFKDGLCSCCDYW